MLCTVSSNALHLGRLRTHNHNQDVEGSEPGVLATASGLIANGSLLNMVLEYSPGVYERAGR
jgi:hypothetical protein